MLTEQAARTFAEQWIQAWNDHDLESILSHYAEDVEYFSVFLTRLANQPGGLLRGKGPVREYLARGLAAYPDLHFELLKVFWGVNSVVLKYRSVNQLTAAEVLEFNGNGLIQRVLCHYDRA